MPKVAKALLNLIAVSNISKVEFHLVTTLSFNSFLHGIPGQFFSPDFGQSGSGESKAQKNSFLPRESSQNPSVSQNRPQPLVLMILTNPSKENVLFSGNIPIWALQGKCHPSPMTPLSSCLFCPNLAAAATKRGGGSGYRPLLLVSASLPHHCSCRPARHRPRPCC